MDFFRSFIRANLAFTNERSQSYLEFIVISRRLSDSERGFARLAWRLKIVAMKIVAAKIVGIGSENSYQM